MIKSEELAGYYEKQLQDVELKPFDEGVGFSIVRKYPKNTECYKKELLMFIKIYI